MPTVLAQLRREYHEQLCTVALGFREDGKVNVADKGSTPSHELARGMVDAIGIPLTQRAESVQTLGKRFESATCRFLEAAFAQLVHLRPAQWSFTSARSAMGIGAFEQYAHLAELQRVLDEQPKLKTALGGDYLITPDIVVFRSPVSDDEMNANGPLVSADCASRSPLRACNRPDGTQLLHASISCKWSIRSDRVQNTRAEALNLIRNRKGHAPRIAVVTLEPLPARLASIALGTGDVDCTYHAALDELLIAAQRSRHADALDMLKTLVDGRRLRDIADLPLDLAI